MFYSQLIRKGLWKRCSFSQTADRYGTITERSKCGFLSLLPPVLMHFALLVIDLSNWELKSVLQTAHSPLLQRESLSYTSKKGQNKTPLPFVLSPIRQGFLLHNSMASGRGQGAWHLPNPTACG